MRATDETRSRLDGHPGGPRGPALQGHQQVTRSPRPRNRAGSAADGPARPHLLASPRGGRVCERNRRPPQRGAPQRAGAGRAGCGPPRGQRPMQVLDWHEWTKDTNYRSAGEAHDRTTSPEAARRAGHV